MGLIVQIKNIQSPNNFKLFYRTGRTPGSSSEQSSSTWGTQYTGGTSVSGVFSAGTTTITIDLMDPTYLIDSNPYGKQYWFKILDLVTGSYIIENIYIHDMSFYTELCATPTPTPTPTVTPDCTFTGGSAIKDVINPTATPVEPTPTATPVEPTPTATPVEPTPTPTNPQPTPTSTTIEPTSPPPPTPTPTSTYTLICDDCFSYTVFAGASGGGGNFTWINCNGSFGSGYVGYEETYVIPCAVEGSVQRDTVLAAQGTLTQGVYCGNTCPTPTPTATQLSPTPTPTSTASINACVVIDYAYNMNPNLSDGCGGNSRTDMTIRATLYDGTGGTQINAPQNIYIQLTGTTSDCLGSTTYTNTLTINVGNSYGEITYTQYSCELCPYDNNPSQVTTSVDGFSEITPYGVNQCQ